MNRVRRVRMRWDQHVRPGLACLHIACADMTYRPAGLLG
jgi:hypothetical protein